MQSGPATPDLKTWMQALPTTLPLVSTCIPASHDSGSYFSSYGMAGALAGAITQEGDFTAQLEVGVRYFDVRCKRHDGQIVIHHGPVTGDRFEDVLSEQIVPFASAQPTEVIFLDIDIADQCEEEVLDILERCIGDTSWIATEYVDASGAFVPSTTWENLRGRRFVITWSSKKFTPFSKLRLKWQTKAQLQTGRQYGDWAGLYSTPTTVTLGDQVIMCVTASDGSIYLARSGDAVTWPSKADLQKKRLFGDWAGVRGTPTMAVLDGRVYMCVTDADGGIYVVHSDDGVTWPTKADLQKARQFGDWSGVPSTPNLVAFDGALWMCLLDSDGGIYLARSPDGVHWPDKAGVERLFDDWGGLGSTPTLAAFDGGLCMCLLDHGGAIYTAWSSDGVDWPSKATVSRNRQYGDWSGVRTTPTLAALDDLLYMCVPDADGGTYVAYSPDGRSWPPKSDLSTQRLFGDWSGAPAGPTMVRCGDALYLCVLDSSGAVYWGSSSGGRPPLVPWMSYAGAVRWSPFDDFNKKTVDEIFAFLDEKVAQWDRKTLFVAQVVDTPLASFMPADSPSALEAMNHVRLNGWVRDQKPGTLNVVLRDMVNRYPDLMQYIIQRNLQPPGMPGP